MFQTIRILLFHPTQKNSDNTIQSNILGNEFAANDKKPHLTYWQSQLLIVYLSQFLLGTRVEHGNPHCHTYNRFHGGSSCRHRICTSSKRTNQHHIKNYKLHRRENISNNAILPLRQKHLAQRIPLCLRASLHTQGLCFCAEY